MTIDEKIAGIADLQRVNAEQLKALLTRDPRRELIYGPQYDPNVARRFQSNVWQSLLMVGDVVPRIFTAPNSVEEITVSYSMTGSSLAGLMLRVEMDTNSNFSNVPRNFSSNTRFIVSHMALLSAPTQYSFNERFPCTTKWLRVSIVSNVNGAQAWVAGSPLNVGFHGQ